MNPPHHSSQHCPDVEESLCPLSGATCLLGSSCAGRGSIWGSPDGLSLLWLPWHFRARESFFLAFATYQRTGISVGHHGPADPDLLCIRSLWSLVLTTCLTCLETLDLTNFFQTLQPPRNLPATVLSSFLVHLSSLSLQASEILSSLRVCCSGRLGRDAYLPPLFQIFCVSWLADLFLWGTTFLAQVSQKTFTDSFFLPLWNSSPEAINTKQHRCLNRVNTKESNELPEKISSKIFQITVHCHCKIWNLGTWCMSEWKMYEGFVATWKVKIFKLLSAGKWCLVLVGLILKEMILESVPNANLF